MGIDEITDIIKKARYQEFDGYKYILKDDLVEIFENMNEDQGDNRLCLICQNPEYICQCKHPKFQE